MTNFEYTELISHRNTLDRQGKIAMKYSEIERLAYNQVNPLNILIHLDSIDLFWY